MMVVQRPHYIDIVVDLNMDVDVDVNMNVGVIDYEENSADRD